MKEKQFRRFKVSMFQRFKASEYRVLLSVH